MTDLITDDFERDPVPVGSRLEDAPTAEGWSWVRIGFGAGLYKLPGGSTGLQSIGMTTSNAIGWRRYRAGIDLGTDHAAQLEIWWAADTGAQSHVGLLVRVADSTHFYYCVLEMDTGAVYIRGKNGASDVLLASDTITVPAELPFPVRFTAKGTLLTVHVDGVVVLQTVATVLALNENTFAGWHQSISTFSPAEFDNFVAGDFGDEVNVSPVLCSQLDEVRRAALIGGRQDATLVSAQGLTDTVPITRKGLIGAD